MDDILRECKKLYDEGFACHWLHSKSKRPIESGWTTGPRKSWGYLNETYIRGLNLGVRLGTPSKIANGYLTVIDVDIKSKDPRHLQEAVTALNGLFGLATLKTCPQVRSGRGNGSRHYHCLSEKPFKTWNPAASKEMVKVLQPSKKPSKKELQDLSSEDVKAGWRLSRAWEVSLYSDGRQVVLPPSIHPDSGEPYQWVRRGPPPLLKLPVQVVDQPTSTNEMLPLKSNTKFEFEFEPMVVDLEFLPITKGMYDAIVHGTDVDDRSGFLLPAVSALLSAGLETSEILSVLTDSRYFLGACAFDHAKTKDRKRAAEWLYKYTVAKVITEKSPELAFTDIETRRTLTKEEADAQEKYFTESRHWTQDLARNQHQGIKPTMSNIILILQNQIGLDIVRRNDFAFRDAYGCDTPWGGKKDRSITDDDIARIRVWLGQKYGFEPKRDSLYDAITDIACANAYDPVKDALDELEQWDGLPRLDTWLARNFEAEGDSEYLAQVFRKWMVAMVMRVYRPGAKFDWMPIFEGAQGVGKSSFGRLLCGDKHFTDWLPNLADKDAALALQGIWVVEMGELSQFRKNEMEVIKGFVTRTTDKVRPPHGRKVLEILRRCVFFGTTNREQYLRDETGNRRFKPVKVGALNFDALRSDRIQLFAEAKHLFDKKIETEATLDLTGKAKIFEASTQHEKMVEDDAHAMKMQLENFMEKWSKNYDNCHPQDLSDFKALDLFEGQGPLAKWQPVMRNIQFAAKALKMMGFEKHKSGNRRFWKWPKIGPKRAEELKKLKKSQAPVSTKNAGVYDS